MKPPLPPSLSSLLAVPTIVALLLFGLLPARTADAARSASPHAEKLSDRSPLEWGGLSIGSHAPLSHSRLRYTPGRVDVLGVGEWAFDLRVSHSNAWGERPNYILDGEFSRFAFRAHYGFAQGWEAFAEVSATGRSPGILDGFIEDFHDLFGVTQSRRDEYARDQLLIRRGLESGPATTILDSSDAGVGMSNPVIGLRYELVDAMQWRPAITLEAGLKLPLGDTDAGYATRGWDMMFHASIRLPFGNSGWQLFAAGGFVVSPGYESLYGFDSRDFQWTGLLGLHIRLATNLAFVFQYLVIVQGIQGHFGRRD